MVAQRDDNYSVIVFRDYEEEDKADILRVYSGLSIEKAYDILDEEKRWWSRHGYKCHNEYGVPSIIICRMCLWFYRKENGHEIAYPRCDNPIVIVVMREDELDL